MRQIFSSRSVGILFGLLLISFLVFQNYFSLDEPNILWDLKNATSGNGFQNKFIADGRPIYGAIILKSIEVLATLENLRYMRIISIALTFIFCLMLYRFLIKKGVDGNISFIISVMIFSLPGFSVFISWAECFPLHFSSTLSFFAGALCTRVFARNLGNAPLSKTKENVYVALAICIQVISLFNYQGLALAFLLPAFFTLILQPNEKSRNRLIFCATIVFIFFITLAIYYKLFKSMLANANMDMVSRGKIGNDPIAKIKWFSKVLIEAAKLHLLLVKSSFIQLFFVFTTAALLIRDLLKRRILDIIFLFGFCTLLFLPHLIIAESWGASRNFVLVSVILVFYIVIRIFELLPAPPVLWANIVAIPFIVIMCLHITDAWVKPMEKDYNYLHAFVEQMPVVNDSITIHIQLPKRNMHEKHSLFKLYYDEFNQPVFHPQWPIDPAIKILYQDKYPTLTAESINRQIKFSINNSGVARPADKNNVNLNLDYQ